MSDSGQVNINLNIPGTYTNFVCGTGAISGGTTPSSSASLEGEMVSGVGVVALKGSLTGTLVVSDLPA